MIVAGVVVAVVVVVVMVDSPTNVPTAGDAFHTLTPGYSGREHPGGGQRALCSTNTASSHNLCTTRIGLPHHEQAGRNEKKVITIRNLM